VSKITPNTVRIKNNQKQRYPPYGGFAIMALLIIQGK